jgi:predicted DNA binding CopG/RHH family protein
MSKLNQKTKLQSLSSAQIKKITALANQKKNVPLISSVSKQVNMRVEVSTLDKIKKLAQIQGLQYTTFLTRLLKEDIDRLWAIYDKVA